MPNKIGVDLDNTILSYENLFHRLAVEANWIERDCPKLKASVKSSLKQNSKDPEIGEKRWQQLQTWVYGNRINEAKVFEGFRTFVRNTRARKDDIFIVSHKTNYSNFDPNINLRRAAFNNLEKRGFFKSIDQDGLGFSRNQVIFASSIEEKLIEIGKLELSHFIDDLPKVLLNKGFPEGIQRIGFGNFPRPCFNFIVLTSWKDIDSYFHLSTTIEKLLSNKILFLNRIPNSGNNRINHAKLKDGNSYVIKEYLGGQVKLRSRRKNEFNHLQALWNSGLRNIPQPIALNDKFAVYSFIEGDPVKIVKKDDIEKLVNMVLRLDQLSLAGFKISNAADCRLCLIDYVDIIESRWNLIIKGSKGLAWEKEIFQFLNREVLDLRLKIEERFFNYISRHQIDPNVPRSPKELIFSPSDFGFHNILRKSCGNLAFLDFEYSGWDDPAKLIADFFHHVAQKVSWELKWNLLYDVADKRYYDPLFLTRWEGIIDLIGLEWILIVLNVAAEHEMKQKQFSDPYLSPTCLINERLNKAKSMVLNMKDRLKKGEKFITIPPCEKVKG